MGFKPQPRDPFISKEQRLDPQSLTSGPSTKSRLEKFEYVFIYGIYKHINGMGEYEVIASHMGVDILLL